MAYGVKYRGGCYNKDLGLCTVDIFKLNYAGSISPLTIAANGINFNYDIGDYFEPIKSLSVSIDIINDKSDFYELDVLFSISDLEYYVRIYCDSVVFFYGYIPCDVVEQVWLQNSIITLNATCNLNRLSEYKPTLFTVNESLYSIIEIIQNCLSFTHLSLPLNINNSLDGFWGHIRFEEAYLDCALFNGGIIDLVNSELEDCGTILKKILQSFSCIIYYYNDEWWIDRMRDIGGDQKNYIQYVDSTATSAPITNTHLVLGTELRVCNRAQRVQYVPGLKSIELTLKEKRKYNYVDYTYDNLTYDYALNLVEFVSPAPGKWEGLTGPDIQYTAGNVINNMYNHITILDYISTESINIVYSDGRGTPPIPSFDDMLRASLKGMYTSFYLKLNPTTATSINISGKFQLPANFINEHPYFVSDSKINPSKYKFYVRFFIGNGGQNWLIKNATTGVYEFRAQNTLTFYNGSINTEAILRIEIPFSDFTDKNAYYHEFSTSISLEYDINATSDLFLFGLCELGWYWQGASAFDYFYVAEYGPAQTLRISLIGDIYITANDELDDNLIIGSINNSFVNVKKMDVDVYDTTSYSLLNCIYSDTNRLQTYDWSGLPLVNKIIEDYFQIFNKVRHIISSDMYANLFFKPFTLVESTFCEVLPGTVKMYDDNHVVGVGTTFLTTFKTGDIIVIFGEDSKIVTNIESNTVLHVEIPGYAHSAYPYPSTPTGLTYEMRKLFFIDGYRYNIESGIYSNMNLKEYVGEDGIS
jgi:hypothetical protein